MQLDIKLHEILWLTSWAALATKFYYTHIYFLKIAKSYSGHLPKNHVPKTGIFFIYNLNIECEIYLAFYCINSCLYAHDL